MKIAVFYNLPFGGAKRVVKEQVAGLKKLGHKIDVYTYIHERDIFEPGDAADQEFEYDFKKKNVEIPVISRLLNDVSTFSSLRNLNKKIAKDIDSRNYDIVIGHIDVLIQAPFLLRFLKTKSVYFCLEPYRPSYEYSLRLPSGLNPLNKLYESINRKKRKEIDRENARSATYTLAISLFDREYMIHAFDLYPKISYLGVDESLFHSLNLKKKKQVLFVAEKEFIYGYDLAVAALKKIPEKKRPELKIAFGTKKSQRISEEALVKLYNESFVTLSLSRFDTFGLVPLESMACGTPVIALNVAGYRETIKDGKTGFLTDFDVKEIAEKIVHLAENPSFSREIGRKGRKSVEEKWKWSIQIKNLEKNLLAWINDK